MRRGEVWWADLPPPSGRRPVVLLSRDAAYAVRNLVLVTPVTTIVRGIPTEVGLGPEDGLPRASVANLDVIITIPKSSLRQRITGLSVEKVRAIDEAIRFALGLEA
ncbi:MAG: type II toxin-antitoxin system PemK/MazF family toxin [Chloroflexi bacterium]|nr:type II toxin-antitoxin system PemK/MazF family toxin [Chloroflexota bacterium]